MGLVDDAEAAHPYAGIDAVLTVDGRADPAEQIVRVLHGARAISLTQKAFGDTRSARHLADIHIHLRATCASAIWRTQKCRPWNFWPTRLADSSGSKRQKGVTWSTSVTSSWHPSHSRAARRAAAPVTSRCWLGVSCSN